MKADTRPWSLVAWVWHLHIRVDFSGVNTDLCQRHSRAESNPKLFDTPVTFSPSLAL